MEGKRTICYFKKKEREQFVLNKINDRHRQTQCVGVIIRESLGSTCRCSMLHAALD